MTILLVRQYSHGYDNVEPIDLGESFEICDLCGLDEARNYLLELGYDFNVKNAYFANRAVKFLPNPNYKLKVYLDASIKITNKEAFIKLVDSFKYVDSDLVFCRHPHRKTVQEEIKACYRLSKITNKQYKKLMSNVNIFSNDQILTQNGANFSRHTVETKAWAEKLLDFLKNNEIKRDQINLPIFLQANHSPKINLIDWPSFLTVKRHKSTFLQALQKKYNFMVRR